jgi:uncharacterized protein (TIGR03437 family)
MQKLFLSCLLGTAFCTAQPFIYTRGIVGAASSLPYGVPAGTIAQGSIFSIYGRNLGPAAGVQVSTYPLNTALSNVSVTVTDGITLVNALPVYVSAGQVNAILPSNAPLGTVSVRVLFNNARSNSVPIRVGANSPGLFTIRGTGVGPAVIQNFVSSARQPVNSNQIPATPGQTVTLYATGLGPVAADNVAPTAGNLPVNVEVFVGGKPAKNLYSGRSPCCAGLDQIVFQVPADSPAGCWVPVLLRVANTAVSNVATMAIATNGAPCPSKESAAARALISGGKIGLLAPLRSEIRQSPPNDPLDLRSDFLVARFGQEKGGPYAFNPLVSLPPAGTCTAYSGSGDWFTSDPAPDIAPEVKTLDAGGITVAGGGNSAMFGVPFSPLTLGYLGSLNPAIAGSKDTSFLAPGSFTIQSAGGSDVMPFKLPFTMISPLTWTNRDAISTIDRTAGFTVNFTGSAGQTIAVVGGNVDLPTNASGVFLCIAAPGATSITVPPLMLANLPPGRGNPRYSKGAVFVVGAGGASKFSASGLDTGVVAPIYISGKAVAVP